MKKNIIVFGGEGLLGKHVVQELKREKSGFNIVVLSRRSGCDMRSFMVLFEHLKTTQPVYIFNCAAHVGSVHYAMKYSGDMISDNILINTNLYKAVSLACPKATIINPLSNCSYPGSANTQIEKDWFMGEVHSSVLSYGVTRKLIYALADSYYKQYKVKTINWLVSNAYGPGDYLDPFRVHALNGIIIRMIKSKKENKKEFEIWGSGNPTREWVYIKDVAKMLVASSGKIKKQIYPVNLAQNKAYSINEITEIIAEALKYKVKFTHNDMPDGAPTKILDDTKFRKLHPEFKFTSLKSGIKETIKYYLKNL